MHLPLFPPIAPQAPPSPCSALCDLNNYLLAVPLYRHHVPRLFKHVLYSLCRFGIGLGEKNPRMKQPRSILVLFVVLIGRTVWERCKSGFVSVGSVLRREAIKRSRWSHMRWGGKMCITWMIRRHRGRRRGQQAMPMAGFLRSWGSGGGQKQPPHYKLGVQEVLTMRRER